MPVVSWVALDPCEFPSCGPYTKIAQNVDIGQAGGGVNRILCTVFATPL